MINEDLRGRLDEMCQLSISLELSPAVFESIFLELELIDVENETNGINCWLSLIIMRDSISINHLHF